MNANFGPVSTATIENEIIDLLRGFQTGAIKANREDELCGHIDSLRGQQATAYSRAYWLALAAGRAEHRARTVGQQAQADYDFFTGASER